MDLDRFHGDLDLVSVVAASVVVAESSLKTKTQVVPQIESSSTWKFRPIGEALDAVGSRDEPIGCDQRSTTEG